MKLLKYMLPCAVLACSYTLQAADFSSTQEARESDTKALAEFVKSKGQITIQEKGGNLMLSGDVRGEWDHIISDNRKHHGNLPHYIRHTRGHESDFRDASGKQLGPQPTNEFDVEVNLVFDYRTDRTWSKIQLQFDNPAGIRKWSSSQTNFGAVSEKHDVSGSGELDNIVLKRAYLGYNICECGTSRFDVEIGRRPLYDSFDSKIQFYNIYDGITLRYAQSFENMMDFYAKVAAFVVDQTINHFGYVGEVGFMNLFDQGVDFKYSYIHWKKNGVNHFNHHHVLGSKFDNSQFTLAYNFRPDFIRYKTAIYGAYLINHAAERNKFSDWLKARDAWYVGFRMGELKRMNDWSIDCHYEWVKQNSVNWTDVRGIGRDNPLGISPYITEIGHKGIIGATGFANYKGISIDGLYNLTDTITLEAKFEKIHEAKAIHNVKHRAYWVTLNAIYSF